MTLAEAPARTGFHTLRVAGVERLCDDAVAHGPQREVLPRPGRLRGSACAG